MSALGPPERHLSCAVIGVGGLSGIADRLRVTAQQTVDRPWLAVWWLWVR